MSRKLKYRKGRVIGSLAHLEICLKYGTWIYMCGRPKHPRVIECMTLGTLNCFIKGKSLYEAILNKEAQNGRQETRISTTGI